LDIAEELVRLGAHVNARDKTAQTPLHFAAQEYQLEMVHFLAEKGAFIDAQDSFGNTPLSTAVFRSRGRGEVIEALLSYGADKHLKNNYDVSPESLAYTIANYDVRQFFPK
jgi:ankyrin repeat protein